MLYTETFKARMVRRMLGPRAVSAHALSEEAGVSQPTLSRWLRETSSFRVMAKKDQNKAPPQPVEAEVARRPQEWTADERLRAVAETLALEGEGLGVYLRRNGIHREQIEQWRAEARTALEQPNRRRRPAAETKRIKELERELRRKDKALAEAAALLVLRKKVQALWGDEDDDTAGKNES